MMINILKSDLYRLRKNKLLYGIVAFTGMISFLLIMLIHQDIRLGISIFGDLTAFKKVDDIVGIGVEYYKGLGILVAVFISVFIGQEYQWRTWQHKWIINKSRTQIYLSKAILSSAVSVTIFLLFESVVLVFSGQMREMMTGEYMSMILCCVFIYAALGAIICLLSMLIKNNTASAIVCLCYVLFSETLVSVIKNIGSFSSTAEKAVEWLIKHSLYGMSILVRNVSVSTNHLITIFLNSLIIILLSTTVGLLIFRKYEL